jgi:two-component system osmolarity sensor histidine kinase EnvZ
MLKTIVPRTLMGRALLIAGAPLVIMQLLSAWVFYDSHWDQVSKKLARSLAGDIAFLVDSLAQLPDADGRNWLFARAGSLIDLAVSLEVGGILPNQQDIRSPVEGELRRALLFRQMTKPFRVDAVSLPDGISVAIQLPQGVLHVIAPRARLFSWTTYLFVLWMVGTSLALLGVAALIMRRQMRPLIRLALVADALGKGREVPDFKPSGAREVRLVGHAFVAMRNRLQRQIGQRTAMLAGVSHDLRTPLTRMKLQLEMMKPARAVAALKEDVVELERMLEGYLAFARGEGEERPEPTDLGQLVADAVRQAARKGRRVAFDGEDSLTLPLKPMAMTRCISNLLDNALRFADRVEVRVARRGRAIEVIVDDNGPGIPEDQREDVFKPFYRIEGSRNPNTGGVGLGLSIARDVARGHGGDVYLEASPTGGLRARLRLPE